MDTNLTPADIKAVMGDANDWGNGGFWIVFLFLIFFGGNWNRNQNYATTGDVERGFYQQTLQSKLDGNTYGIADATYALNNSIKDSGYANTTATKDAQGSIVSAIKDGRYDITDRITNAHYNTDAGLSALSAQLSQCCCDNKTLQLQNKYDLTNAIHDEGEKTRALIQKDKIETLQGRINQLELESALCGVVRYPQATTFTAGVNPFYSTGTCACGGYGTTF